MKNLRKKEKTSEKGQKGGLVVAAAIHTAMSNSTRYRTEVRYKNADKKGLKGICALNSRRSSLLSEINCPRDVCNQTFIFACIVKVVALGIISTVSPASLPSQ